jgi:hypothetical protein
MSVEVVDGDKLGCNLGDHVVATDEEVETCRMEIYQPSQ